MATNTILRPEALIRLVSVSKTYPSPAGDLTVLRNINLTLQPGCLTAVVGRSGSGKTTLLNMLAGIDLPTRGEVMIANQVVNQLDEDARALWRGLKVGIVFQFFQLIPTLTVLENVLLPMELVNHRPHGSRVERARSLLEQLEIAPQADQYPALLSGGQQQRAAIARALANDPEVIIADEPTGNLDSRTAAQVFILFRGLAAQGKNVVIVTHDPNLANQADRTIRIEDGQITNN
jgi:putative ABC transport system ATP-binding protein